MGRKAIFKLTRAVTAAATVILFVMTICTTFAGKFDPNDHLAWAVVGFMSPIIYIVDIVLLFYWLIFTKQRYIALLPFLALIYASCTQRFYCMNWGSNEDKSGVIFATYNVGKLNNQTKSMPLDDLVDYLSEKKVSVVCFQEFYSPYVKDGQNNCQKMKEEFPYIAMMDKPGYDMLVIASKYPILQYKYFMFANTANDYMWADLSINGKVVRVYNLHLQTTAFNSAMRDMTKRQAMGDNEGKIDYLTMFGEQYFDAYKKRATQVNYIKRQMASDKVPSIVCGDFNDLPFSYTYNKMVENKKDGFMECGNGYGYTYRYLGKWMRIDYILYDEEFEGVRYESEEMEFSDHNPVLMKIHI
jgi:endonuclease/exonuclease/phosphatase family metal-dependent hydrolase